MWQSGAQLSGVIYEIISAWKISAFTISNTTICSISLPNAACIYYPDVLNEKFIINYTQFTQFFTRRGTFRLCTFPIEQHRNTLSFFFIRLLKLF